MKKLSPRKLAALALLAALQIVLSRMFSLRLPAFGLPEGIRIGFEHLPLLLAGMLFGPAVGLAFGAGTDLIGSMVNPMMGFNPLFTARYAFSAMLAGLVWNCTGRTINWRTCGTVSLAAAGDNIILTPLILKVSYGIPLTATVWPKILIWLVQTPLTAFLLILILQALTRSGAVKRLELNIKA